jgi:hypothetical protein
MPPQRVVLAVQCMFRILNLECFRTLFVFPIHAVLAPWRCLYGRILRGVIGIDYFLALEWNRVQAECGIHGTLTLRMFTRHDRFACGRVSAAPCCDFRGESKDQDMNFSAIRASCIMHHHRIMFHRVTPIGSEARNRGFTIPWVARRLRPAFIRHVYGIVNCIGRYDCWQPWRLAWVSLVVRKVTPFQDHRCHCDVCNTSSRLVYRSRSCPVTGNVT